MTRFRNIPKEVAVLAGKIDLQPTDLLIEFGCGTSEFALFAATIDPTHPAWGVRLGFKAGYEFANHFTVWIGYALGLN